MRKLKCLQMAGTAVQEVLDEFNERRKDFGVVDGVSVSAIMPILGTKIATSTVSKDPKVEVVDYPLGLTVLDPGIVCSSINDRLTLALSKELRAPS